MAKIYDAIANLINSISGDAVVGVFAALLGTFVGWILTIVSQMGNIFVSDITFEFPSDSDKININKSTNTQTVEKGKVYGCDVFFSIVSTSIQEKLLRNIELHSGYHKINIASISEEYEKDFTKYFKNTEGNAIKLKPKEYKKIEIYFIIEELNKIEYGTKNIKLKYGDYFIKKSIKLGKYDLRNLLDKSLKEKI